MTDDDPLGLAALDEKNGPKPEKEIPAALAALVPVQDPKRRQRQARAKFNRQDLTRHVATCVTCGASNDRRNAQAWSAGHVNSNAGHRVALVLESVVADRDLDEADRLAVLDEAAALRLAKSDPAMAESRIDAADHVAGDRP